jgi:putative tryptophan/tyrosine transport system substrate-binding protein
MRRKLRGLPLRASPRKRILGRLTAHVSTFQSGPGRDRVPVKRQEGHLMRRREFIVGLGGAVAWPLAAQAQQRQSMRRIGFLWSTFPADDPEVQVRGNAFVQGLQELNWSIGRNLRIDYRWGLGDASRLREAAQELVALAPDALFAAGGPAVAALQQATRSLPIVFTNVTDPVGAGYVNSMARPGGNATGFMNIEYSQSGKWLELLKQIAPHMTRVAVLRVLVEPAGASQFAAIQAVAPPFGVEVIPISARSDAEIERGITDFARVPNGGLVVTIGATQRDLIIGLAARYGLPAVYFARNFVTNGGLICYGPDLVDLYRRSASYVDRVLKGEKPADLPVQAPTKYELVINLRTAMTLGLDIPTTVLVRADEVIE